MRLGSVLLTGSSTLFLGEAFSVSLKDQSALIFIWLPLAQLAGTGVFGVAILWLRLRGADPR